MSKNSNKNNNIKKMLHHLVACPSCQATVEWKDTTLNHPNTKSYFLASNHNMSLWEELVQKGNFKDWLCNNCLETAEVILADWTKQDLWGYDCFSSRPILLYRDETMKACKVCKEDHLFSAKEKQFWYETAKIFVGSKPKMCKTCRKESKRVSAIAEPLKYLLEEVNMKPSKEGYQKIEALYLELGKMDKAGVFREKAKYFKEK